MFCFTVGGLNLGFRVLLYDVISISLINDLSIWVGFFILVPTTIYSSLYIGISLGVGCALYIGVSLVCILHISRSSVDIAFSVSVFRLAVHIGFCISIIRLTVHIGFCVGI